jgi:hypothetical protein
MDQLRIDFYSAIDSKDRPRLHVLKVFLTWCKQHSPEEQPRRFNRDVWEEVAEILAQEISFEDDGQRGQKKARALANPSLERPRVLLRECRRRITPFTRLSPRLQSVVSELQTSVRRELQTQVENARQASTVPSPDLVVLQRLEKLRQAIQAWIQAYIDTGQPVPPCLEEVLFKGCDRAIPNELCSLLPGLCNLRPLLLSHRHGLRSHVPLMDVLPNATKPDHPKVQDDLSAG